MGDGLLGTPINGLVHKDTGEMIVEERCGRSKAPPGWQCTRAKGHDGPCAAVAYSKHKDYRSAAPYLAMSLLAAVALILAYVAYHMGTADANAESVLSRDRYASMQRACAIAYGTRAGPQTVEEN